MQCLLHIGLHKTGSSSIQAYCFRNAERLEQDHAIAYYPHLENHSLLSVCFLDDYSNFLPLNFALINETVSKDVYVERLRQQLSDYLEALSRREVKPDCFVLSGEGFGSLKAEQVERIYAFLKPYFSDLKVLAYVREPFGYLHSAVQQIVKSGYTYAQIQLRGDGIDLPSERVPTDEPLGVSPAPNYRRKIGRYIDIFGRDAVEIRCFDPSRLITGEVVGDFFQSQFGIAIDPPERVNESLPPLAVDLIESLNRLAPPFVNGQPNLDRSNALFNALKTLSGSQKYKFRRELPAAYLETLRDDIRWLSGATGGEIDFSNVRDNGPESTAGPDRVAYDDLVLKLNQKLLGAEQNAVEAAFFRELVAVSLGRPADTGKIIRLIGKCGQFGAAVNMAGLLTQVGLLKLASQAVLHAEALLESKASQPEPRLIRRLRNLKLEIGRRKRGLHVSQSHDDDITDNVSEDANADEQLTEDEHKSPLQEMRERAVDADTHRIEAAFYKQMFQASLGHELDESRIRRLIEGCTVFRLAVNMAGVLRRMNYLALSRLAVDRAEALGSSSEDNTLSKNLERMKSELIEVMARKNVE